GPARPACRRRVACRGLEGEDHVHRLARGNGRREPVPAAGRGEVAQPMER
ncbi:hypothetical protein ACSTIT_23625, partial [Vibrio parahaemolyticus]